MHEIGCELVILLLDPDEMSNALIFHVGHSRINRIWDGNITRITKSHLRVSEESEQGTIDREVGRGHLEKGMSTHFIGVNEEIEPEIQRVFVQNGDRYIICTSGITDHVCESELMRLLDKDSRKYADSILKRAEEHGAKNSVVQIIDICSSYSSARDVSPESFSLDQQNRSE